jgi:NADPH:quinone reductase-like Zn-dependent oxidoreductase
MRVVCLDQGFGLHNLRNEERAIPSYGPDQILIRVRAVSLNARDVMIAQGTYNPRQRLPLIVGSDAAGEVVACGSNVTEWAIADRVCPIFASRWQAGPLTREAQRSALGGPVDGTLCEYLVADASAVVRAPAHLNAVEAACLPCAGVTAYRALVELAQIQAGQWLVCQGTGGVSLSALGIAKALGVRVIITSRSAHKLARALALGADHGIDTSQTADWGEAVRALSDGQGAHQVIEVGGAQSIVQSLRAVRLGGTLSVIGVLSGSQAAFDLRPILMQELRVQGVFVGSRATFLGFSKLVEAHTLRPEVDRVFELGEARAAFEYLASGQHFGKVVISLD